MIFLGSIVTSGIAQENDAQISAKKLIETDVGRQFFPQRFVFAFMNRIQLNSSASVLK